MVFKFGVLLGAPRLCHKYIPINVDSSSSEWSYSSTYFSSSEVLDKSLKDVREAEDFGNNFIILFQTLLLCPPKIQGSELLNRCLKNYGQIHNIVQGWWTKLFKEKYTESNVFSLGGFTNTWEKKGKWKEVREKGKEYTTECKILLSSNSKERPRRPSLMNSANK